MKTSHKIILFLLIIFFIAIISNRNNNDISKIYIPDKYDAYVMMKKFVKDKLKAPSTADFEPISTIVFKNEGNIWAFVGYVDSDNSFGAHIRINYSIGIRYHPEDNSWGLVNLIFHN